MGGRFVSLFWRLIIPNVTVLGVACAILIIEPANGRIPALGGGLIVMATVNAIIIRRATQPLTRLTTLMHDVDPMQPGQRVPLPEPRSEVTLLAEAFNSMLDRLETERRESSLRMLSERERERRRVAGELHDQIGQMLTALSLQADRLAGEAPDALQDEAEDLRDGLVACIDDVRRLARELRPEALDTLGLVPALTNLSERMMRRTGIEIVRSLERRLPAVSEDAELVIYRVAQESMTNALRHAAPSVIDLTLRCEDGRVILTVCDDGVGFTLNGGSVGGIRSMRERALSIGAELRIAPRAHGPGTEVTLEVPAL